MKVLKTISQYKYFYIIVFIASVILAILRLNLSNKFSIYSLDDTNFKVKVINVKKKKEQYIVELLGKEKLISYEKDFPYDVGDILDIEGSLVNIKGNTIPNLFDYKTYYNNKGIFYELKIKKKTLVSKNSNILNKLKTKIIKRLDKLENSEYLYAFILSDTSYFGSELQNIYNNNGIFFLFSIGTVHIFILSSLLEKIKEKLRLKEKYYLVVVSLSFLLYLSIINIKIGILRSSLCYLLRRIKKWKKLKIKDYDIIILIGSLLLIIYPFYLNNQGFYYSFIISYGISKLGKYIKGNYVKKILIISLIANILSFPINIYYNYKINLLTCLFNVIISPLIHFILFPLSILYFLFPFIGGVFNFFVSFLEDVNNFFNNFSFFTLVFRKPNILVICLYYLLMIIIFKKKKMIILFLLIIFIHLNINNIYKENLVTFLDVGQGDCTLIKRMNKVILIDTGGNINYSYANNTIKYINSLGISKINSLILTHGDYDHMGEAINLVNNFKVDKVIFNCGEFNELETDLIKVLDKKKIPYYSCIKELDIDNNKLYFLQTKEYDNENDNSNVIYTEIDGYKFMFMGDAGVKKEKDILDKYNISDINVLKVGHHGSKTSSSEDFINEINPKYSIISVGNNNRYGHPNKEVLNNLENSIIYRTDQAGSIMFKIKNNKLKIENCSS